MHQLDSWTYSIDAQSRRLSSTITGSALSELPLQLCAIVETYYQNTTWCVCKGKTDGKIAFFVLYKATYRWTKHASTFTTS